MGNKKIAVKKIGERSDYYREYFKSVLNGRIYVKIEFRGAIEWFTCDRNGGEPDLPIKKEIQFVVLGVRA